MLASIVYRDGSAVEARRTTMTVMPVAKHVVGLPPPGHAPAVSFEETAAKVLGEVQGACAALLDAVPGAMHRAVDLEKSLRLDKKLAWQVFKLAQADQPLAEAVNVPARSSVQRLLTAARKRRVPAAVVERLAAAFESFEEFAVAHGGDRTGLLSLVSGIAPDGTEQVELKVRKSLFRGNAHVWGMQVGMVTRTFIVYQRPGAEAVFDGVLVSGYVGMQRLRPGARVAQSEWVGFGNDPAKPLAGSPDPADRAMAEPGQGATQGLEILEDYSTQPLPEFRRVGDIETEIVFPAPGRAGAVTLYTSRYSPGGAQGEQSRFALSPLVSSPIETLVVEVLVPEGLSDPGTASVAVYGRRGAVERTHERRALDLLPQRESVTYLGAREAVPPIPEAARHSDAVRQVLDKLGWLGTKFDVYRCRVQYPVLHTLVCLDVDAVRR